MTCIAGFMQDGRVHIGGDSAGIGGLSLTVRADRKVFTNGPYAFGIAGSFRMGDLLRYSFKPPKPEKDDLDRFMRVDFVNAVRACFKDGGFAEKDSEDEKGGTFLRRRGRDPEQLGGRGRAALCQLRKRAFPESGKEGGGGAEGFRGVQRMIRHHVTHGEIMIRLDFDDFLTTIQQHQSESFGNCAARRLQPGLAQPR
jgi:hypothetical protein